MTRIIQAPLLLMAHEWWEARQTRRGEPTDPFAVDERESAPPEADPHGSV
jgi:hypothetical protein